VAEANAEAKTEAAKAVGQQRADVEAGFEDSFLQHEVDRTVRCLVCLFVCFSREV
jgi:hypothetical protein